MFQLVEPGLTQREQQVVELLMQGCENEEIAKELGIAPAQSRRISIGCSCGLELRTELSE
jgi:FixJ family two-component response regulator